MFPSLKRRLAPLMGVTCPTTRNAGDGQGKGKGKPCRVPIGSEPYPLPRENGNGGKGQIRARFPRFPNTERSVIRDDITRTGSPAPVAPVATVSADESVQTGFDRFNGVAGFDQNPDLDHVPGFTVVGRGRESRRDDDPMGVFVQDKSVHRTPPRIASTRSQTIAPTTRKPKASNARAETRDWSRFMGLNRPGNRGTGDMVQRRAMESNKKI